MNDEIKEILNGFKEILDNPTTTDECYDGRIIKIDRSYELDLDEIKTLLDYITNLQHTIKDNEDTLIDKNECIDLLETQLTNSQQENHDLKSKLECYENGVYYSSKVDELQQENERLKEQLESVINENQRLLKQWFENNNKTVKLVSEKEYYNQNFKDYKTRCEKAIKYIEKEYNKYNKDFDSFQWWLEDLLNILQNGSDSQ